MPGRMSGSAGTSTKVDVCKVLDRAPKYKTATCNAVAAFAKSKPFTGSIEERKQKFRVLHAALCTAYGRRTVLNFDVSGTASQSKARYNSSYDSITVSGKLSVVTYLRSFARVLGHTDEGSLRWAVHLFKLGFPNSYAKCVIRGGKLINHS